MKTLLSLLLAFFATGAEAVTLTVKNSPSTPTAVIFPNTPNTALGGFDTIVVGDYILATDITFDVGSNQLFGVGIYDTTGTILAGPVDSVNGKLVFTDTMLFGIGTNSHKLSGRLALSSTNSPLILTTNPSLDWRGVSEVTSGNPLQLSNEVVRLSRMIIFGYPTGTKLEPFVSSDIGQVNMSFRLASVASYNPSLLESTDLINWQPSTDVMGIVGPNPENSGELLTTLSVQRTNHHLFFRIAETPLGRLTISTDQSTTYQVVSAGSVNVTAGGYRFHASQESVNLQRIGLRLTQGSANDLVQATIWNGSTQVGTAIFVGGNVYSVCTLSTPVLIPKDQDVLLTVKLDLSQIGIGQPVAESGHLVAVDYDDSNLNRTAGIGVTSGETITASGSTAVAGVRMFKSYPTFVIDPLPDSGIGDGRLIRFKVTASASGDVSLYRLSFNVLADGIGVNDINLYGYTDSLYSQPISGVGAGGQVSSTVFFVGDFAIKAQNSVGTAVSLVIPAGQTRYFELRGTAMSFKTTYYVTTKLKGDGFWPQGPGVAVMSEAFILDQYSFERNVIWSPNTSSQPQPGGMDLDWTNGYGLPGLPQGGLVQTRTP